jgi:hypothetical protein
MTSDQISKFLEGKDLVKQAIKIDFKTRNSITGIFLRSNDFAEMKSKNFWRIVTEAHFSEWKQTNNTSLAKIFNGSEFTRLSEAKK